MKPRSRRARLAIVALAVWCSSGCAHRSQEDSTTASSGPESAQAPGSSVDRADPEAAARVVREYYRSLDRRDHGRAWLLWADSGGASGQTLDEFRRGFEETAAIFETVGPAGRIEGAAGSRFIEVPVTLRAVTVAGASPCFRGTLVLRRSDVPGATEAQQEWRLQEARLTARGPAECGDVPAADSVVATAKRFGRKLALVPLIAPREQVGRELRRHYGDVVSRDRIEAWARDPASAPGRRLSSPWPDHLEVQSVGRIDPASFRVRGVIVLVTSVEEARGGGAAAREPVEMRVTREDDGAWRIASVAAAGQR